MIDFRKDFSILKRKIKGKPLAYLDNAATSLTPDRVVRKMNEYYEQYNANVHRGVHELSQQATQEFDLAREKIARFINASGDEVAFTSGTTESLNLLALSLAKQLKKGDEIVLTEMEHHSNLVPWQQIAKDNGFVLKFIKVDSNGELDMESAKKLITSKTKVVSATQMSNVLGTVNDIKSLAKLAHSKGALIVVDAAQSVTHMKIDVKDLDCDFLAFSGHKLMGPTGIGVIYGKKSLLENLEPSKFGGGMISEVTFKKSEWNNSPLRFEAGTPNIAGAIGLGAAVDYLNNVGMGKIEQTVENLTAYALIKLSKVKGLEIYGPKSTKKQGGLISFSLNGIHPHDVSAIVDSEGLEIRGGHMCAMPLVHEVLKQSAVCRVSFQIYNTKEEVDRLCAALEKAKEVFRK